jgi:MYXO-CTERM domain-containing protein
VRFFDDKRGVAACLACTGGCEADAGNPTFLTAFMRTEDGGASWAMDPDYEGTMTAPPFGAMAKYSGMLSLAFPNPNAGFLAGQNNLVLRYTADAPEPDGWGQATCSGAGGGAGAGGGGSGGKSGVAPNFDDSGSSGCGCRTGPAAGLRAIASLLALAAAALVRAHRRARR